MQPDMTLVASLHECSLRYGSWEKRLVRTLIESGIKSLNAQQAGEIRRFAWSYRKQLAKRGVQVPESWRESPVTIPSSERVAVLRDLQSPG